MLLLAHVNFLAAVSLAVGSTRAAAGPVDPMTAFMNNLSEPCAASAAQLLASDFAACSDAMDFMAVIGAQSNLTGSLMVWSTNICKTNCSDEALSEARAIVTSGCSKDLQEPNSLPVSAITNYPALRHGGCSFDKQHNTSCLANFVTTYEKYSRQSLTISSFIELGKNASSLSLIPAAELCVDCNKVLFTLAYSLLANSTLDQKALLTEATTVCPATFTDLKNPSTVTFEGETPAPISQPSTTTNVSCTPGSNASSGCNPATSNPAAPGTTSVGSRSSAVDGSILTVFALIGGFFIG
ncbi:BZ3500_MvSof-1268-A1-R1_Chr2-1g04524 [Microbotryum saponariae]|uniref:BZ3500_MvSof-1268-A1-R1_Chr2-1g04524 protein n=1 Tax=Microbotryum saponariae TaxID=289078 RepID=A0A2X0MCM5_9BASI|nr:BZ3500_MvSof-1268-A1-R1_Chr2-1g04524 [Microbotryum saponariae]SCZ91920.1 BZ3501_MvSof-1269-A2-R1_Chr2-1g04180 [Microbotryum saponariae]